MRLLLWLALANFASAAPRARLGRCRYVTAEVVDESGVRVPKAADLVRFAVSGPGEIVAVDNADNASHESFRGDERHAYQGRCVAVIRAKQSGAITVTALVEGLAAARVRIDARQAVPRAIDFER